MPLDVEPPAPIDIERLVWWALGRGRPGGLPWRDEAVLSFDRGLTARPRRKPRGNWTLVFAGAGTVQGQAPRRVVLDAIPDGDAARVVAAVKALPAAASALVIRHGRSHTRPGWTERIETAAPTWAAPGRPTIRYADPYRRALPYCPLRIAVSEVVTEAAICRYEAWWGGLAALRRELDGQLARWRISGFAAPERPWEI
jgi:hypothetical protein